MILLVIIGILKVIYISYWREKFFDESINNKAVAYYHYFRFIGRIIRCGIPAKASEIAEKATFGRGEISQAELQMLIDECKRSTEFAAGDVSEIRKKLYRFLSVKI